MLKVIAAVVLSLAVSACASNPPISPTRNQLDIVAVGNCTFYVDGRRYSEHALASELRRVAVVNPDITIRVFIPSRLIGLYKQDDCYAVVGYEVRASIPLNHQEFFEWAAGDLQSRPIPCDFAVVG